MIYFAETGRDTINHTDNCQFHNNFHFLFLDNPSSISYQCDNRIVDNSNRNYTALTCIESELNCQELAHQR